MCWSATYQNVIILCIFQSCHLQVSIAMISVNSFNVIRQQSTQINEKLKQDRKAL